MLHKEEACRGMAAWWRLIRCRMRHRVGCRGPAGASNGVWASIFQLFY